MSKFIKVGEVRHPQTSRNTKARAGARASERGQDVLAPHAESTAPTRCKSKNHAPPLPSSNCPGVAPALGRQVQRSARWRVAMRRSAATEGRSPASGRWLPEWTSCNAWARTWLRHPSTAAGSARASTAARQPRVFARVGVAERCRGRNSKAAPRSSWSDRSVSGPDRAGALVYNALVNRLASDLHRHEDQRLRATRLRSPPRVPRLRY